MDIQNAPFIPAILIVILPFIALAIGGMLLARIVIKKPLLLDSELRSLSTISSVTGGLYGLLLGLIVVNLWQDFKHIQTQTIDEATSMGVLYGEVKQLSTSESDSLQLLLEEYIHSIVTDGWRLLTEGKENKATSDIYHKLAIYAMNIKAESSGEEHVKDEILDKISELYKSRQERLQYARSPRIPPQMWVILIIGAVITITATFLFPISSIRTKMLLTASYSGMIGLIFFLIICLNHPFKGAISISPEAYISTYNGFKKFEKERATIHEIRKHK